MNMVHGSPKHAATIVELLRIRAEREPDRPAYSFLLEDGEVGFSYGELDRRVRSLAAWLAGKGLTGERALLLYPPGPEYLVAFYACLYAGVLAVPAYPPRMNGNLGRLQSIVDDAQASAALTTQTICDGVARNFADAPNLERLEWLVTDEIGTEWADEWRALHADGSELAFLQYTSGSTALPKGVMLSHGNLLHNLALIERSFGTSPESRGVLWLPPYHDMGLIGGILQPLYTGYPMTLMAPVDFITQPLKWLQTISRVGGTVAGGPNFAYELCVKKVAPEQREGLDLSRWEQAFTGAEPIRAETLERFAEFFAPCGFRREAFYPCYGLAEGTLFVSGGLTSERPVVRRFDAEALKRNEVLERPDALGGADEVQTLVSSGRPVLSDQQLVIADPERLTRCADGRVGEIWVAGGSVAQGYWRREEQTKETFGAHLAESGQGPFLRTGDLGFVHDGELYVTGRRKDLIIIRGRNFYPQDVEFSVQESHPGVQSGNGAAFSVEMDGEERLVVVQEVERKFRKGPHEELFAAVRRAISRDHQLQVYAVVLIKPASVPKTSSGKVQRHACWDRFLNGTLDVVAMSLLEEDGVTQTTPLQPEGEDGVTQTTPLQPEGDDGVTQTTPLKPEDLAAMPEEERRSVLEAYLLRQAAKVLKVPVKLLEAERSLHELGLDSLMAVELKHLVEKQFDVALSVTDLLEGPSIRELAGQVLEKVMKQAGHLGGGSASGSARDLIASETAKQPAGDLSFPLSYGQRSLWFLQKIAPESAAYNIARAVRIRTDLDVQALQTALQGLADRHPALRTTFSETDGQPRQTVHDRLEIPLVVEQASAWQEENLQQELQAEANRPFDLEKGSLLRARLFARSAQEAVLVLTVHHIIVDFWSFGLLLKELGELYGLARTGHPLPHAGRDVRYREFVQEQMELLESPRGEHLWSYWREQLDGQRPMLNLPTDRPRPPVQTYRGATRAFALSPELTERLKQLAKREGGTLYMTLLAAWQMLLHRYTGQEEIRVGSPTAGRNAARYAEEIGYFVNPLVLRSHVTEELTARAFLQQVRQTVLGALKHQEFPFALLVERLQPNRELSDPPLVNVMFTLQNALPHESEDLVAFALSAEGAQMRAGELLLESMPLMQQAAQVDLSLMMGETGGRLSGVLEYNTDLFDDATVERLAGHFETLLHGLAEDADRPVSRLPLLTEEERHLVLDAWNDTATAYDLETGLHQRFEQQVERTPDAPAVVYEGVTLTYAELNRRANQVAHVLQRQGVGPDVRVGVCMDRSLELVVALYGILKAGGAYVPVDPAHPADRIAYVLADAGVPVLLTQAHVRDGLPENGAVTLCMDADWETVFAAEAVTNPESGTTPDSLAYMIYTSGSTGRPKGVLIPHRGICNRLLWMQEAYRLTAEDRVLQKTPYSFDVSVWEFFWPLLVGATLVVAKPGGHQDSEYLVRVIAEERITTLHFVPSLLQVFLQEQGLVACRDLRQVICSGEALPYELQMRFFSRFAAPVQLHNLYGPTEASVDVTHWTCRREAGRKVVPIGNPIANIRMYVLDAHLQPVPVGVAGELHIGGVGLARGYHNRPELTEEKFIADPFANEPGARLYKTGDLARYLPDGAIEYLGRIDHQVKIRGLRIETGEIEAVLLEQADVREAVVMAREDRPGDRRLVAYLTVEPAAAPSVEDLREHALQKLPEYMVPAAFVLLPELPLSPNGKVDRKQLPAPDAEAHVRQAEYVEPGTETERRLAGIWADLLQRERVGAQDNFFHLGGHSLLGMQVISRIRKEFGVEVPVNRLFEQPTVAAVSQAIEELQAAEKAQAAQKRQTAEPSPAQGKKPSLTRLSRSAHRVE